MALTPSTMVDLGTQAPDFQLPSVSGKTVSLSHYSGSKGLLVAFICNHCPYVIHIQEEFVRLAQEYQAKGIGVVAINSNDVQHYPDDSFEKMQEVAINQSYCFEYLFDETQEVAKAYDAACTPDFFLFDATFKLVYRGQMDDSRPKNGKPLSGKDLRQALDCVLSNKACPDLQIPSQGCNIKWKKIFK